MGRPPGHLARHHAARTEPHADLIQQGVHAEQAFVPPLGAKHEYAIGRRGSVSLVLHTGSGRLGGTAGGNFFVRWYIHVPYFAFVAVIYAPVGCYILSLFFGADGDRVIMPVCVRVTGLILRAGAAITRRAVLSGVLLTFTVAGFDFAVTPA